MRYKATFSDRIRVGFFQAVFNGLSQDNKKSNAEAFVQAIAITSDESVEAAMKIPRRRKAFVMYLEMLKGNALARLFYKEEKLGPKVKTTLVNTVRSIDKAIKDVNAEEVCQ